MPVYRVNYNADGRRDNMIVSASSEAEAKKRAKKFANEMGYAKVTIIGVVVIEK